MGSSKKIRKQSSLKAGRPPTAAKPRGSISSQATQKTIVTFHQLNKRLEKAKARGDIISTAAIQSQLDQLGGIKAYQEASIQGQAVDRGGDSSAVLMKWLEPVKKELSILNPKPTLLEIGALSIKNQVSKSNLFDITRIDLNSQSPGIQQQDFMDRPIPIISEEKFHIISLSLVLNFVPDEKGRGDMLRHTTAFLHACRPDDAPGSTALLFLVLPAPCVLNSRYCNEERLALIMASLGYALLQRKQTSKLVYHLWQLRDKPAKDQRFEKKQLKQGGSMNNFCIVLK